MGCFKYNEFWGCGTRPFTIEELRKFFRTFDVKDREELRTRLYFLIQFYLGLRKNSVDKFNLRGIVWNRRVYRVIGDKGKNRYENKGTRIIPIPYELYYHLRQHYESDYTDIVRHNGYFFYTEDNDIPYESKYQNEFRKHIGMADLNEIYRTSDDSRNRRVRSNRKLHTLVTHSYRKTYSAWLLENGCDLATLMELLGHNSFLATHRYTKLALRRKIDIVSKAFDGRVPKYPIKPLILLDDTPIIETEESIVNVSLTKKQLNTLVSLGIIDKERNVSTIISSNS